MVVVLGSVAPGNQAITFRLPVLDGDATPEVPFDPPVMKPPICWRSAVSVANADWAPERFPACKSCASVLKTWLIGLVCWEEEEDEEEEDDCELSAW